MKTGKCIFQEDDALPIDMELMEQAWERLFGEPFDHSKAIETDDDGGPETYYKMPNGKIVCSSYRGNSAIYEDGE